jgi:cell division protein FtsW (lipid II flippase)
VELTGVDTDFLLSYLVYRLGWCSFLGIAAVFCALFAVGFRLRHRQSNRLGRLISLAVLATLLAQTGFYILANLGLPLVSFGGSALTVNMILPGVLLSTFRMDSIARDRPGKTAAAAAKC